MISGAMTPKSTQASPWPVVRRQHGVITRWQLLDLGFTDEAIRHRLKTGRLHRIWPQVYSVGRPHLEREGILMAAVLTCGDGAALSHHTAAELWTIRPKRSGPIHISLPSPRDVQRTGIETHRRRAFETARRKGIRVTTPAQTIIDIAPGLTERQLERTIDEADKLDLIHPEPLRDAAAQKAGEGAATVRNLLEKRTFLLSDSDLERLFIPIAERAGLEKPETQARVNGHRVDFFFRDKGVVVEADGGRFHRTPSQQRRDRIRDHDHTLAGLRPVRFTHDQIAHEPDYVARILRGL